MIKARHYKNGGVVLAEMGRTFSTYPSFAVLLHERLIDQADGTGLLVQTLT